MADLLFVIKALVLTIIVVVFMQVKIGSGTIEHQIHDWIKKSYLTEELRKVSEGGVKLVTQSFKAVQRTLDTNVGKVFDRNPKAAGQRSIKALFGGSDDNEYSADENESESTDDASAYEGQD